MPSYTDGTACDTCGTSSDWANSTSGTWYAWTADNTAGTNTTVITWSAWTDDGVERWVNVAPIADPVNEEARTKAAAILERHLTEEQRAQLARDRFFVVRGSKGRDYRVHHGRARNIEELDAQGRAVARLCAHPGVACPDEDTMLAQKLMLEHDEEAFRRIANRSAA